MRALRLLAVVLTVAIFDSVSLAQTTPPSKATGQIGGSLFGDAKCDCAIFPWTPDACVKTCTARFLTLPMATLEKSLDAGAYKFNIEGIQKQGVTSSEVDIFLKGKDGKLFLESVGKTDAKTLRMLAYESSKTSINKGE